MSSFIESLLLYIENLVSQIQYPGFKPLLTILLEFLLGFWQEAKVCLTSNSIANQNVDFYYQPQFGIPHMSQSAIWISYWVLCVAHQTTIKEQQQQKKLDQVVCSVVCLAIANKPFASRAVWELLLQVNPKKWGYLTTQTLTK